MTDVEQELPGRASTIVLAVVFAVLFAYPEFQSISNLISYPAYAGPQTPWPLLILSVVVAPVLYAGALLLGRRRPLFSRALLFAVGLGAANALLLAGIDGALALVR